MATQHPSLLYLRQTLFFPRRTFVAPRLLGHFSTTRPSPQAVLHGTTFDAPSRLRQLSVHLGGEALLRDYGPKVTNFITHDEAASVLTLLSVRQPGAKLSRQPDSRWFDDLGRLFLYPSRVRTAEKVTPCVIPHNLDAKIHKLHSVRIFRIDT